MRKAFLSIVAVFILVSSAFAQWPPYRSEQQDLAVKDSISLKHKLDSAKLVVSGEVYLVRPARELWSHPISEHDPNWQWAEVGVYETLKGKKLVRNSKIIFLFPDSWDVAWVDYPKFRVRDRGIFIVTVKKMDLPLMPQRPFPAVKVSTITALLVAKQGDFQPIEKLNEIKKLLKK